ncbi:MAG: hypothetical protein KKC71_12445 [Chloroflexi bacterium]|jgi:hypothetical protein|nr:hypothetical protein [Chloroflexota bacterium]
MKKSSTTKRDDYELRDEYDLSKMTVLPKGRFDPKRRIGTNVVVLDPEIAKAFPNDEAVNEALRLILRATKIPQRTTVSR